MRLAYFSPLGPQASGIADYSEELLPHLAAGADITLYVEGFRPSNAELVERFRVRDYRRDPSLLLALGEFDAVVYHMGNDHRYHAGVFDVCSAHAGIVVFHDFALQAFFLGLARERGALRIYLDGLAACHGDTAAREAGEALARGAAPSISARPLDFPLNCRLARAAEAVIVHSDWSRERFRRVAPGVPVRCVRHHITRRAAAGGRRPPHDERAPIRIASFGLITPDKGIERALRALSSLRERHDFRYTLVGQPNDFFDVRALVREYGLEDRVEITGHVALAEFERRINETDIALNLRERTVGETSGSLCRVMAAGVAAVVSDVGWFSELPDDAVVKIDAGEHADELLRAYLERLIEDAPLRTALGANARRHVVASHGIKQSAEGYLSFIRDVIAARPRRRLLAGLSSELNALGVRPDGDGEFVRGVASEVAALAPEKLFAAAPREETRGWIQPDTPFTFALPLADPAAASDPTAPGAPDGGGRPRKIEGGDYKRAAAGEPRK